MLEGQGGGGGGGTRSFGVVFMLQLQVFGHNEGGAQKVLPRLEGGRGGRKQFRTRNFPIL